MSTSVRVHSSFVRLDFLVILRGIAVYASDSFFVTGINVHDPTVTVLNYTTGNRQMVLWSCRSSSVPPELHRTGDQHYLPSLQTEHHH